ncbi:MULTISPECIES: hypothetical protein [Streptomyces]|uniref:hypothetical protein n=1 Tax=Streptomyces TaxID=1883 RepID=UPI001422E94D|nr:hypothetical protein [Streptomyces sp. MBT27]
MVTNKAAAIACGAARRVRIVPPMAWTSLVPLVATVLGALIAVGAGVVGERVRWHRNLHDREHEALRMICANYLSAVSQAGEQIWQASRAGLDTTAARRKAAHAALGDHDVFPQRFQVALSAPQTVVDLADATSLRLIAWADIVIAGRTHEHPECDAARRAFNETRKTLIESMRMVLLRDVS